MSISPDCLDGDVFLRAGLDEDIAAITQEAYTHAGMCTNVARAAATHCCPSHGDTHVYEVDIDEFFDISNAPGGGAIHRHDNAHAASSAAHWASLQTTRHYTFSIYDPILGPTGTPDFNYYMYCSEFVWWAYHNGAGIDLVPTDDFENLLDTDRREHTLACIIRAARHRHVAYRFLPEKVLRDKVEALIACHNGYFVTPAQLSESPVLSLVRTIVHEVRRQQEGGKK